MLKNRPALKRIISMSLVLLLVAAISAVAYAITIPDNVPAGDIGVYRLHSDSTPIDVNEVAKHKLAILNAWDYTYIPSIKAINPDIKLITYKCLMSTRSYCAGDPIQPTGVDYNYANNNHPEWFQTYADTGARIEWSGFPGHWEMDVGNVGYQDLWCSNVKAELQNNGWDGVFLDNANPRADAYHDGRQSAQYANDSSWQTAMNAMLTKVQTQIGNAGFLVIGNISEGKIYTGAWDSFIGKMTGSMEEWFTNWSRPGGSFMYDGAYWKEQVDNLKRAQDSGKWVIPQTGSSDGNIEAMRYGLASSLLATNGKSLFTFENDAWYPEYDWNIGTPSEAYHLVSGMAHVYHREFTDGLVIVNADPSASYTNNNLSATYLDHSGNQITSITLPAMRGVILRKVGGSGGTNLALNKSALASSQESANLAPAYAFDGNMSTRWASQYPYRDAEWLQVDLGSSMTINKVTLKWEAAYGKTYKIQVSTNGTSWTDVYSTTTGNGGTDDITFTATSARYVRMYGTQRGTTFGYSLWEMEVYNLP